MADDLMALLLAGLKAFENIKPGVEGLVLTGTALAATGKVSVHLVQKGAKSIALLISHASQKKTQVETNENIATALGSKKDIAIILDINNRIVANVETFLKASKIDANVVVITNDPAYSDEIKRLDVKKPEEWNAIVREFKTASMKIKRLVSSNARIHIFMAVPLPMAFGLGAVWGTVNDATVYHWENNTYYPVMKIDRKLRF